MRFRIPFVCLGLAMSCWSLPVLAGHLAPGVSCELKVSKGDLWILSRYSGVEYRYLIGAGGAIEAITDNAKNSLLQKPYKGNHTDRVVQFVTWAIGPQDFHITEAQSGGLDTRYNVNQAGNVKDLYSPIARVSTDPTNCAVEVVAIPQNQFYGGHDRYMNGRYTSFVRYEIVDGGALKVDRLIYFGSYFAINATVNGQQAVNAQIGTLPGFYFENWIPLRTSEFSRVHFDIDANSGQPLDATDMIHGGLSYQFRPINQFGHGYMVAAPSKFSKKTPNVFGVVFGTQSAECANGPACPEAQSVLNFSLSSAHDGFAMMPSFKLDMPAGSYFEDSLYIYPNPGLTPAYAQELQRLASQTKAIRVFRAGSPVAPEWAAVAGELKAHFDNSIAAQAQVAVATEPVTKGKKRKKKKKAKAKKIAAPIYGVRTRHLGEIAH